MAEKLEHVATELEDWEGRKRDKFQEELVSGLIDTLNAAIDRINDLEEELDHLRYRHEVSEAKYENHRHDQQRFGDDNIYRTSKPSDPSTPKGGHTV